MVDRAFSDIAKDLDNRLLAETRWSGLTISSLGVARDASLQTSQSLPPLLPPPSFLLEHKARMKAVQRQAHKDRRQAQNHYAVQQQLYVDSFDRLTHNERAARFLVARPLRHESSSEAIASAPRRLKRLGGLLAGDFTSIQKPTLPPGGKDGLPPFLIAWVHPLKERRITTQETRGKQEAQQSLMVETVAAIVKQREMKERNVDTYKVLRRGDGANIWGSDRTSLAQLPEGGISYAKLALSIDKYG